MREDRFKWRSAFRTHVGRVRRLNEDACLELPAQGLWAVADGMGGHAAGEVASRMVVDSLRHLPEAADLESRIAQVRQTLQAVNDKLGDEASRRWRQLTGSTVAALLIGEGRAVCLWAGDSRVFLLRDRQLKQLTRDHSQLEEMIAQGRITREQAETMRGNNAITRAIGAMERLELDLATQEVREGDRFLLCSDGLYNEVSLADIERLLAAPDCDQAAELLLKQALQGRARDNISVIVVQVVEDQATRTVFNPSAVRQPDDESDDDQTTINR